MAGHAVTIKVSLTKFRVAAIYGASYYKGIPNTFVPDDEIDILSYTSLCWGMGLGHRQA